MSNQDTPLGVYGACYSGVPVFEFQFGDRQHVMRRRKDDWINATHILKAAGYDKPARTRILEREVQKDVHEKIQGGYGKYQGTWIPMSQAIALAKKNNVYDQIHPIFEYEPGATTPPPAPRHTNRPKAVKKPAAAPKPKPAKATAASKRTSLDVQASFLGSQQSLAQTDDGDAAQTPGGYSQDTPDDLTLASLHYLQDDDLALDTKEQQHSIYGDALLDYFLLSRTKSGDSSQPKPPPNFEPDRPIDTEGHTALHWASSMGDIDVVRQLLSYNASVTVRNERGETPLMRSVNFTNCHEKDTFPDVMRVLFDTVDSRDNHGRTVIHHAAIMKGGLVPAHACSRYYLENLLIRLEEVYGHDPDFVQRLIDAQDRDGNTALHLAAKLEARKCVRTLIGRNARTDIPNNQGIEASTLILNLNSHRGVDRSGRLLSSSPSGCEPVGHASLRQLSRADDAPLSNADPASTQLFRSDVTSNVLSTVKSRLIGKMNDLSTHYDDRLADAAEAEANTRRILAAAEAEYADIRTRISEADSQLESQESLEVAQCKANALHAEVLDLVAHRNYITIALAASGACTSHNSSNGVETAPSGDEGASPEEMEALRIELAVALKEQTEAQNAYIEALGGAGAGDKIAKYRHTLKLGLDPHDAEVLDESLDSLIELMEETRKDDIHTNAALVGFEDNGGVASIQLDSSLGLHLSKDEDREPVRQRYLPLTENMDVDGR